MLEVRNLVKRFGGLAAVNDVSVTFEANKINAIIGPNGAGKSTFFNLVAGALPATSGQIIFSGQEVTRLPSDKMAKLGVGRTFQSTSLFDQFSVLDNLIVGHKLRTKSRFWDVLVNSKRLQRDEKACREKAKEVLEFVGLDHVAHRMAADISQEEKKRVAFALALATEPKMVLLDEPAGGVNPEETESFGRIIRKMVESGITVCLIEHKMDMIMSLADKIMVLDHGAKIAEGTPEEVRSNAQVIEAYLGSDSDA